MINLAQLKKLRIGDCCDIGPDAISKLGNIEELSMYQKQKILSVKHLEKLRVLNIGSAIVPQSEFTNYVREAN